MSDNYIFEEKNWVTKQNIDYIEIKMIGQMLIFTSIVVLVNHVLRYTQGTFYLYAKETYHNVSVVVHIRFNHIWF